MENAQLIGLSKQIALRRQMNVVANNIANINTTGFKVETLLFEEHKMPVARDRDFMGNDQILSYTQDWATIHNFTGGSITQTGNELDVALSGEGFLSVETASGEQYTRNGELKINNQGILVTNNGDPVLSEGGQIRFEPNESNITIDEQGYISTDSGSKGRLKIVTFDNLQSLTREGDNLFAGLNPVQDLDTKITQGAIERSNVSSVLEMARMIEISRSYQTLSKIQKSHDDLRSSAIQKLGTLKA